MNYVSIYLIDRFDICTFSEFYVSNSYLIITVAKIYFLSSRRNSATYLILIATPNR